MFFQKVLKGVTGISDDDARAVLATGIQCNWWRNVHTITPAAIHAMLTPRNLDWHLNKYEDYDPVTNAPFSANTPFISTSAGCVDREAGLAFNIVRPAFLTALFFATNGFRTDGFIFYGYVFTLGKQGVQLAEFAEEVRELNIYQSFLPFYREGEVVAKIEIPTTRLERAEKYLIADCRACWSKFLHAKPTTTYYNPNYLVPEGFANIRDAI